MAIAKDPEQTALIEAYETAPQTLSRVPNVAGESALGNVIADAQLGGRQTDHKFLAFKNELPCDD